MYRSTRVAFLLITALLTVSCGDDDPVFVVPEPPPQLTVFYDGTLPANTAARSHFFEAQHAGDILATITAMTPDTAVVGLSIGTGAGVICQAAVSTESASVNTRLPGLATRAGPICVRIYHPADEVPPVDVTYTIRVEYY